MRVLVCGGRDYDDGEALEEALLRLDLNRDDVIVHGDAAGADALAEKFAKRWKIPTDPRPALWDKYGKSAGPIRNSEMLIPRPDYALVFPGDSGTRDMMNKLFRAGVPFQYVGRGK